MWVNLVLVYKHHEQTIKSSNQLWLYSATAKGRNQLFDVWQLEVVTECSDTEPNMLYVPVSDTEPNIHDINIIIIIHQ